MKRFLVLMAAIGMMLMFTACSKCVGCGERKFSTTEVMGMDICDDCMDEAKSQMMGF